MSVTVVSCGRHNISLSVEWINHPDGLVFSDIKFNFLLLENLGNHFRILFDNIIVDGVVVEHVKVCGIYSHFHLINKLLIIQVDGLHDVGIYLVLQEQMHFGDSFALQVMEEGIASDMLADQID